MDNKSRLALISGDLLIFMFFSFAGRETHVSSDPNLIVNALPTLLPFLIIWSIVAALLGVYRPTVYARIRTALLRTLSAWIIAGPIAIIIRAVLLGRTAIPMPFVIVTLGLVGALLLVWHGAAAWYSARRSPI